MLREQFLEAFKHQVRSAQAQSQLSARAAYKLISTAEHALDLDAETGLSQWFEHDVLPTVKRLYESSLLKTAEGGLQWTLFSKRAIANQRILSSQLAFEICRSFVHLVGETKAVILENLHEIATNPDENYDNTGMTDKDHKSTTVKIATHATIQLFKQLDKSTAQAQVFITEFLHEEYNMAVEVDTAHASEYLLAQMEEMVELSVERGMLTHHEGEQIVDYVLRQRRTVQSKYEAATSDALKSDVLMCGVPALHHVDKSEREALASHLQCEDLDKDDILPIELHEAVIILRGRVTVTYHPPELEGEHGNAASGDFERVKSLERGVVMYESAGVGSILPASMLMTGDLALLKGLKIQAVTNVEYVKLRPAVLQELFKATPDFEAHLWCLAAKEVMRMMPQLAFEIRLSHIISPELIRHCCISDGNEEATSGALLLRGSVEWEGSAALAPVVVPPGHFKIRSDDVTLFMFPFQIDLQDDQSWTQEGMIRASGASGGIKAEDNPLSPKTNDALLQDGVVLDVY